MDDFSVFCPSRYDTCLSNLDVVLKRWRSVTNLVLNWEKRKRQIWSRKEIFLAIKVSAKGIEVDQVKIEVIEKLPPSANVKGVKLFLLMPISTNNSSKTSQRLQNFYSTSSLSKILILY